MRDNTCSLIIDIEHICYAYLRFRQRNLIELSETKIFLYNHSAKGYQSPG